SQPDFKRPAERKIHQNYYFNRDTRRNYPATAVYTSEDLVKLVGSGETQRIAGGSANAETGVAGVLPPRAPGSVYKWQKSLPHL
ncbi:hypothetical protein HDU99_010742, partial [Rhizoclosmatium hyalinum]